MTSPSTLKRRRRRSTENRRDHDRPNQALQPTSPQSAFLVEAKHRRCGQAAERRAVSPHVRPRKNPVGTERVRA